MESIGGLTRAQRMTLEAFADTMIPGERRRKGDRAIAGAATGGGAVACGAVELMVSPEGGLAGMLDSLVEGLNEHAVDHAAKAGLALNKTLPPFVALSFQERTELARRLLAPTHPEQELWVSLAMFSAMAWDTGAHMHTTEALASGHPGLTQMGFAGPDPDGLWRFPRYSYRRVLATPHPHTTSNGDPR